MGWKFRGITAALLLCLLLPSCRETGGGNAAARTFRYGARTLVGLEYGEANGMTWGDDFHIELTQGRIVSAKVFSRLLNRYVEKTDKKLDPDRWAEIAGAVLAAAPSLEEVPAPDETEEIPPASDAPPKSARTGLWLTWETEAGERETVRYYVPHTEEFDALRKLFVKTAR